MLKHPKKLSIVGFESDYSEQEVRFISEIQNKLTNEKTQSFELQLIE